MPRPRKWRPTETQERVRDALQESNYTGSIREACKKARVSYRQYYRWFDCHDFRLWWKAEADKHFLRLLPSIYGAAATSALGKKSRGSSTDRRLLIERYDESFMPRTKQELHATVGVEQVIRKWDEDQGQIEGDASDFLGVSSGEPEALPAEIEDGEDDAMIQDDQRDERHESGTARYVGPNG